MGTHCKVIQQCDFISDRKVSRGSPAHSIYHKFWEPKLFLDGSEIAYHPLQAPSTPSTRHIYIQLRFTRKRRKTSDISLTSCAGQLATTALLERATRTDFRASEVPYIPTQSLKANRFGINFGIPVVDAILLLSDQVVYCGSVRITRVLPTSRNVSLSFRMIMPFSNRHEIPSACQLALLLRVQGCVGSYIS